MRGRRLGLIRGLVWALSAMSVGCDGGPIAPDGGTDAGACEGRALCAAEGTRCDGDSLVSCEVDADGCIVETMRTTCESGCLTMGGVARCIDESCAGVSPADRCDTAGRSCNGTSLEVCAPNANGCLVRSTTPCDAVRGCGEVDGVAACLGGPCVDDETCDTEERRCDGDALRVCERDAAGCLQRADVDCAARGELCGERDGRAVCGTTCAFRPPCVPRCDGRMATTCVPDADGCLVEGPATDCGAGVCAEGVGCVGNCPTAQPQALACNTTVMGNTAGGGNLFTSFSCGGSTYGGPEVIQVVSVPEDQWVEVDVTWTAGAAEDYDLFVVDGGDGTDACGTNRTCLDASLGRSDNEYIAFRALAGRVYYVVFTRVGAAGSGATTDYTMQVACRPAPTGCTFIGYRPQRNEILTLPGSPWFIYAGLRNTRLTSGRVQSDELNLEFNTTSGRVMEGAHSVTFTGENYSECATCALIAYDCVGVDCASYFLAQSGTAHIDELSFSERRIRGHLEDMRYIEVTLAPDGSGVSTPIPGGRTWCIPSMRFSAQ